MSIARAISDEKDGTSPRGGLAVMAAEVQAGERVLVVVAAASGSASAACLRTVTSSCSRLR